MQNDLLLVTVNQRRCTPAAVYCTLRWIIYVAWGVDGVLQHG